MSRREFVTAELFNLETEINNLIQAGQFEQATEKIRQNSELYEFEVSLSLNSNQAGGNVRNP